MHACLLTSKSVFLRFLCGSLAQYKITIHAFWTLVVWVILCGSPVCGDTVFYVSTQGSNAWSGRLAEPDSNETDGPFATLIRARNEIRKMKSLGELKLPVTVYVRSGKYYLNDTFRLNEQDSGSTSAMITYAAYPGEKPIISGGVKLVGWKPYLDSIYQCDIPQTQNTRWKFRQLFADGKRQIRARYPNYDPADPLYGGWITISNDLDLGAPKNRIAFRYQPGEFPRFWSNPTQGEINIIPCCCGVQRIIPIASVDEEARIITVAKPAILPPCEDLVPPHLVEPLQSWLKPGLFSGYCGRLGEGARYFVENLIEELDTPGEWCLDSETGTVYYWPEGPVDNLEMVAPRLDSLIDMANVEYVTISGLTFTETTGGDTFTRKGGYGYGPFYPMSGLSYCGDAVHLQGCRHCSIENCHFNAVGGNAIYLEGTNSRNRIQSNIIEYAGATAVILLGSEKKHPLFNVVENNHIHHTGVYNKYAPAVCLGVSGSNFIRHNLIEYVPHHAINLGNNCFGRNYVEFNRIRFACQETMDTGAINTWMEGDHDGTVSPTIHRPGHIIRYNYLSDIPGPDAIDAGISKITFGIYLDNYSSNCVVEGNLIVRVSHGAVVVHDGKNNLIENNIMVDCGSQIRFQECWRPLGLGFIANNCFRRNILYFSSPNILFSLWYWSEQAVAESDYNLFFNRSSDEYKIFWHHKDKSITPVESLASWKTFGFDAHSIIADPMFVDPENEDYHLKPQSPAFKLGFLPIPFDRIGPHSTTAISCPHTADAPSCREYHVSVNGCDTDDGSAAKPLRTISTATQ